MYGLVQLIVSEICIGHNTSFCMTRTRYRTMSCLSVRSIYGYRISWVSLNMKPSNAPLNQFPTMLMAFLVPLAFKIGEIQSLDTFLVLSKFDTPLDVFSCSSLKRGYKFQFSACFLPQYPFLLHTTNIS